MINEKKLSTLIKKSYKHIVNVFDDHIQYCNGYVVAILGNENYSIIQTLLKVGAIENYRNLKPTKTQDLSAVINCDKEVVAIKTQYIKEIKSGEFAYIFKIGDKHYIYNKECVDIFKNVTYKASFRESELYPLLRFYENDKFIGLLLGLRETEGETDKFIKEMTE